MKLWALSDLHLGDPVNRAELGQVPSCPDDWLVLAGDVGETERHLELAFEQLGPKFQRLIWVPGNHELWTHPKGDPALRGERRYLSLVELCRAHGVLTPEDPFVVWPGEGGPCVIAPLFLLYDYSFRPDEVTREDAVGWAAEAGILCVDERLLHPDPYATREAWCAARCELAEARLGEVSAELPTVLINHYPLRRDHAWLPAIPRFSIWCGTRRTEDWHRRFRAKVVVSGHLHLRTTRYCDGVRFEEVSLGYARQWKRERGMGMYLREVLPGPPAPLFESLPRFHR